MERDIVLTVDQSRFEGICMFLLCQTGKLDKNFRVSRAKKVACARVLEFGARQQTKLLVLYNFTCNEMQNIIQLARQIHIIIRHS